MSGKLKTALGLCFCHPLQVGDSDIIKILMRLIESKCSSIADINFIPTIGLGITTDLGIGTIKIINEIN